MLVGLVIVKQMMKMNKTLDIDNIQDLIVVIKETPVIFDSDVARLYGVETKRVNEAVSRNLDKFPKGYVLSLQQQEWHLLKSHNATSIQISNKGGKIKPPKAFTEKGLYMLATILKSKQATKTTLQIIETFAKIRNLKQDFNQILNESNEAKKNTIGTKFSQGLMGLFLDEDLHNQSSKTKIKFSMFGMSLEKTINKSK